MILFTSGWFDWMNNFPLWLQFVIGLPIGLAFMAIICLSIIGMQEITKWIKKNLR